MYQFFLMSTVKLGARHSNILQMQETVGPMTVTSFICYFLLEGTLLGRNKDVSTAYQDKIFSCHGLLSIVPFPSLCFSVARNKNQPYSGEKNKILA